MALRSIVFKVDLSDESRRMIPYATEVAQSEFAKLLFVYVDREIRDEGAWMTSLGSSFREELESYVPTDPTVTYEHHVLKGLPGDAIVSFAKSVNARLILLPSQSSQGFWRRWLGDGHSFITRHAPCPVVSLRPDLVGSPAEAGITAPASLGVNGSMAVV